MIKTQLFPSAAVHTNMLWSFPPVSVCETEWGEKGKRKWTSEESTTNTIFQKRKLQICSGECLSKKWNTTNPKKDNQRRKAAEFDQQLNDKWARQPSSDWYCPLLFKHTHYSPSLTRRLFTYTHRTRLVLPLCDKTSAKCRGDMHAWGNVFDYMAFKLKGLTPCTMHSGTKWCACAFPLKLPAGLW